MSNTQADCVDPAPFVEKTENKYYDAFRYVVYRGAKKWLDNLIAELEAANKRLSNAEKQKLVHYQLDAPKLSPAEQAKRVQQRVKDDLAKAQMIALGTYLPSMKFKSDEYDNEPANFVTPSGRRQQEFLQAAMDNGYDLYFPNSKEQGLTELTEAEIELLALKTLQTIPLIDPSKIDEFLQVRIAVTSGVPFS